MLKRISPPLNELQPGRVCLIKPSALGDVVQTLPILTMLRSRWPQAHLAWVVNRSLASLLAGHPNLDEVIGFDRARGGWRQVPAFATLCRQLRGGEFDLTIDLQGLLRSGLMGLATGSRRRVGFASAREGASWTYTDRIKASSRELPALERYQLVAAALGCEDAPPPARLGITDEHRRWAFEQLAALPRPWLVVHPGAQWQTKRWPPQHFAELARRASDTLGAGIVLAGGRGDIELCQQIAKRLESPVVNLADRTNLLQLAALCQAADVFLSGDTGPMHLAAAVGTRVVSVFTCTSPLRAGPRGQQSRVVATHVPCAASYLRRCGSLICMSELTPDRVWPVLRAALEESAAANPQRIGA